MSGCVHGPDGDCGRKSVVRDMCMTHYRRWRKGASLDTPVRRYQRYGVGAAGECVVLERAKQRTTPFNAEVALLQELGLR
ncbi:hypothetical protein [Mycobacteroides abscessus]|uniref:hypothetical protein n=1 Tax=Mycobacteroides abscessus TaxID=36809 RepID=UPI0009CBABD9|nr:hypothetical protein [Mycobacteroides abscessus]SKK34629.1 Uncharacterised protein [Mycobacteroides abscessus subsp. massiliense]SKM33541.1 Uncharacterised protein [Mycobacteroides abscessus subsp. massiliense]SKP06855.1 Uncharacterised protein [Mycobacteroides abscessus subsp. massiliense]SKP93022.1 Uncharacterised protein [Mycobacteroides abscessus subsp. massiliense]SLK60590.1 Uncharacterised protein [Mycobacteroides abscessus subsp. massiliense]